MDQSKAAQSHLAGGSQACKARAVTQPKALASFRKDPVHDAPLRKHRGPKAARRASPADRKLEYFLHQAVENRSGEMLPASPKQWQVAQPSIRRQGPIFSPSSQGRSSRGGRAPDLHREVERCSFLVSLLGQNS